MEYPKGLRLRWPRAGVASFAGDVVAPHAGQRLSKIGMETF
jgi:hypothetical protein